MTLAERLTAIVQALPDSGAVTLPVSELRQWLSQESTEPAPATSTVVDMTVAQCAERFGRSVSTIRTWLGRNELPGAYRLYDREWRIPLSAIEHLQREQAKQHRASKVSEVLKGADISEWRNHLPRAS